MITLIGQFIEIVGIIEPVPHPDGGLDEDAMVNEVLSGIAEHMGVEEHPDANDRVLLDRALVDVTFHEEGGEVSFTARFQIMDEGQEEK